MIDERNVDSKQVHSGQFYRRLVHLETLLLNLNSTEQISADEKLPLVLGMSMYTGELGLKAVSEKWGKVFESLLPKDDSKRKLKIQKAHKALAEMFGQSASEQVISPDRLQRTSNTRRNRSW